jgi:hypothetical protein
MDSWIFQGLADVWRLPFFEGNKGTFDKELD